MPIPDPSILPTKKDYWLRGRMSSCWTWLLVNTPLHYDLHSIITTRSCFTRFFFSASKNHVIRMTMSILPVEDEKQPFLSVDRSLDAIDNTSQISPRQIGLIKNGAENALLHGPKVGCPVGRVRRRDFNRRVEERVSYIQALCYLGYQRSVHHSSSGL